MKIIIVILFILICFQILYSQEKVGLALSGGAARGLAQIGMLKVFDEQNIKIDYIAGTSMGSIIGGLYAMGYSALEIEDIFLKLDWEEVISSQINRESISIGEKRWMPYAFYNFDIKNNLLPQLPQALLSGNTLLNTLFTITFPAIDVKHFDDLNIPFRCVATNVETGEMKIIENWKLHEAMRASMSLPSIFQPFQYNDDFYIDGGITANLPVEIVKNLGADYVIGLQTNSGLKESDDLANLIEVIDQTINIAISKNVEKSQILCDLLIKPELENIKLLDFNKIRKIIEIGEIAALQHLDLLQKLPKRIQKREKIKHDQKIYISNYKIFGNDYLSKRKIKEYLNIEKGMSYTGEEITKAVQTAYHSTLFEVIYPIINKEKDGYELVINVKERNRKRFGININYRDNNEITAGFSYEMNNVVQPNSKLIGNIQIGAKKELNIDYVKNFGKHWGIYFHIFPFIRESRLHLYNDNHEKTNSVKILETSAVSGIGIFAKEAFITEFYTFGFKYRLYQDVGEFESKKFSGSGAGIKIYHESLDDLVFPIRGSQGFIKFSWTREGFDGDNWNKKFFSKLRLLLPIDKKFAIEYKFEYGSYFQESELNNFDPFYIGGIDSFMGLEYNERSAPIYKLNAFTFRWEFFPKTFTDITFNILNLGNTDTWEFSRNNLSSGFGILFGYKSFIGPLRGAVAMADDKHFCYYISLGYDFDPFSFSRK